MLFNLNGDGYYTNMNTLTEDNFSIVPDNTIVWEEDLPFKPGETFPPSYVQQRANLIKTNEALYNNRAFNEIFSTLFNFNDLQRDALTNMQILKLMPYLPDFTTITDIWVDLLSAKCPKIEGTDDIKMTQVSSVVSSTNFAVSFQELIRQSLVMHGNSVCRIDRQVGGKPRVALVPLKNWIPFVSANDPTSIAVNCVFNVVPSTSTIEFMLYHEGGDDTGKVEKLVYKYDQSKRLLGEFIDSEVTEAFDGAGVSPIVVFTGQKIGNTVYGETQYKKWEASISSSLMAYKTILDLTVRAREYNRILPKGAVVTDESTGVTYTHQTGSIQYDPDNPNTKASDLVHYAIPTVPMKEAIDAYKETLMRVTRDTDLDYSLFDKKELGSQISGKTLKAAMFKTELRAKSLSTLINNSAKQVVVKLALASGVDIDVSDFTLLTESGFVNDTESLVKEMVDRLDGQQSITLEDAISRLDDVSLAEAKKRASEIRGIEQVEDMVIPDSDTGDESTVVDLELTAESNLDASGVDKTPSPVFIMGNPDIDLNKTKSE